LLLQSGESDVRAVQVDFIQATSRRARNTTFVNFAAFYTRVRIVVKLQRPAAHIHRTPGGLYK